MSSSYAVQLQRIYGVTDSEYVGYGHNDLHIVPSNDPAVPRNRIPIPVSSNSSSTNVKPIGETGASMTFNRAGPSALDKCGYIEKGK